MKNPKADYIKGAYGGKKALTPISRTMGAKTIAKRAIPAVGAAIGAYELYKNTPKIIKGAKKLMSNWGYIRKSRKKTKAMKKKMVAGRAKKEMVEESGRVKYNKSQDPGKFLNKGWQEYKGRKKKINENYEYLD